MQTTTPITAAANNMNKREDMDEEFDANVKDQAPAERRLPASACSALVGVTVEQLENDKTQTQAVEWVPIVHDPSHPAWEKTSELLRKQDYPACYQAPMPNGNDITGYHLASNQSEQKLSKADLPVRASQLLNVAQQKQNSPIPNP